MGKVARVVVSTHVGKRGLASVDQGLLPLPAPEKELSESRLVTAARDNVTFSNLRKDFATVLPLAGASSWVLLLVYLLNYMWLGCGPADRQVQGLSHRQRSGGLNRCLPIRAPLQRVGERTQLHRRQR